VHDTNENGDLWNWVQVFLQDEGPDEPSEEDEDFSSPNEYSDFYESEDDDFPDGAEDVQSSSDEDVHSQTSEENENDRDSEISNDMSSDSDSVMEDGKDDEEMSEPEIPFHISEIPIAQPIINPEITMNKAPSDQGIATQTQTPPITPEQLPSSRKRPLPLDDDENNPRPPSEAGSLTTPTTTDSRHSLHSAPSHLNAIPDTSSAEVKTIVTRMQSDYRDSRIDWLTQQNLTLANRNQDLEQVIKRRRIDDAQTGKKGWIGEFAKSVGKYTVAGVIGGVATFVGLVWSSQK
jgi:hypothetical protein